MTHPELTDLLARSVAKVKAMTPEQYAAMIRDQAASWARGMGPCEHGVYDFEDCPKCWEKYRAEKAKMKLWLLLVIHGQIQGTWGPLPYDEAECLVRAQSLMTNISDGIKKHPEAQDKLGGAQTFCLHAAVRPELGSAPPSNAVMPL